MRAKWPIAVLLLAAGPASSQDAPRRYHHTVSAERVVVDVHAIDNAGASIPGYYLLTFERPRLARGRHAMSIRLPGRPKISVLARPDYQD